MLSPKNLDLPPTRTHAFDETINLVGLSTCLSDFRNNHVRVETSVRPRWELQIAVLVCNCFHAYEHMLLCVVQPMSRPSRPDDALKLGEARGY